MYMYNNMCTFIIHVIHYTVVMIKLHGSSFRRGEKYRVDSICTMCKHRVILCDKLIVDSRF